MPGSALIDNEQFKKGREKAADARAQEIYFIRQGIAAGSCAGLFRSPDVGLCALCGFVVPGLPLGVSLQRAEASSDVRIGFRHLRELDAGIDLGQLKRATD
jgi:hypothetical protein